MKKAVLMLLSIIMMLSFTQAYTLTVTNDVETVTENVAEGKRIVVGLSDHSPTRYIVNAGNVVLKILENRRTFTMPAENVDISIKAKTNESYIIMFESNGGSAVEDKTVVYEEMYGELPISTMEGYVFAGWYSESELTTRITSSSIVVIESDHTLYAKWVSAAPTEFNYTGDMQEFTVPVTGVYKLDVYGAGSGNSTWSATGGYSSGYTKLNAGETIYIVVGGKGLVGTGGYNGGGNATASSHTGGGGATHIAYMTGTLAQIGAENLSEILIVAGGAGGAAPAGTSRTGGDGGGLEGEKGENGGLGGTQTSGYLFGQGGSSGSGGGGGLWGGYGAGEACAGGGGSGYIGGVEEFIYKEVTYSPSTEVGGGPGKTENGYAEITFIEQ